MFSLSLLRIHPFLPSGSRTSDHVGRVVSVSVTFVPPCKVNIIPPVVSGVLRNGVAVIMTAPELSEHLRYCVYAKTFDSTMQTAEHTIAIADILRKVFFLDRRQTRQKQTAANRAITDTHAQPSIDKTFAKELKEYTSSISAAE